MSRHLDYFVALNTVTRLDSAGRPNPIGLRATTPKEYVSPGTSPSIRHVVAVGVQVAPPGKAVTRYPVIGSPPAEAGAFHETTADLVPATAVTRWGLLGTPGRETT